MHYFIRAERVWQGFISTGRMQIDNHYFIEIQHVILKSRVCVMFTLFFGTFENPDKVWHNQERNKLIFHQLS